MVPTYDRGIRNREIIFSKDNRMNLIDWIGAKPTRRTFLGRTAAGLGTTALGSIMAPGMLSPAHAATSENARGVLAKPHFPPKVKRVIWLKIGRAHV